MQFKEVLNEGRKYDSEYVREMLIATGEDMAQSGDVEETQIANFYIDVAGRLNQTHPGNHDINVKDILDSLRGNAVGRKWDRDKTVNVKTELAMFFRNI